MRSLPASISYAKGLKKTKHWSAGGIGLIGYKALQAKEIGMMSA